MNRQALVGLFTIIGLLGLFAIFLVLANVGTGGRYQTAVHFKSAAGLHRGALVYESGVIVGVVDETRLLPEDFTVDVILGINNNVDVPRDSTFLISAPLTGDTTLEIIPPLPAARPAGIVGPTPVPHDVALLPREILPLDQQPQGTNPATLTDLLEQGQGQIHRLDRMLGELEAREPKLLDTLQSALSNANGLTAEGSKRLYRLADRLDAILATLQVASVAGSKNVVDLTGVLDETARRDSGKVDSLLTMLNQTSVALNETVDSARDLATNPQLKQNLLDASKGLATTTMTIGEITKDFHKITSDPQTQAQLKDTIANVDAATQKLNSLMHQLGGTSSVPGVDDGATPAPGSGARGATVTTPAGGPTPSPVRPASLQSRLGSVAKDLLAVQIRLSELDAQSANPLAAPQLTANRGPQTDLNLVVLPNGKNSLFAGANDVGTPQTTANFALEQRFGKDLRLGGGMLYSNFGGLLQYNPGLVGFEARVYNLRYPTVDTYANLNLSHGASLFGGERDLLHNGRRTVFGLQLQF